VIIRVLLVDDTAAVRRLVRTALRFRGGFEVVGEAGTGGEAVELARELQPDVVVLDLGLPDIAGRDVLTRVRDGSPSSAVVIFSGTEPVDRAWFDDHAAGYVLKDVELDYLVDLLEAVSQPRADATVIDLPDDPASVVLARKFVREKLNSWQLDVLLDDAFVVVSELATNAIRHAGSAYRVGLSRTTTALRIEIRDSGPGTPEPQPPSSTAENGRGLLLVAALAASWGIDEAEPDGKVVWAELALPG
jgi:DNA-binding NarL/FixJ family response regulator